MCTFSAYIAFNKSDKQTDRYNTQKWLNAYLNVTVEGHSWNASSYARWIPNILMPQQKRDRFKIQDSRQLYLIDEKLMTRFAVKMELYYTLNYSYKIYTTQMNRLQFPMMIIYQTFEHIEVKISNLKLYESQEDINDIIKNYNNKISQPYITTKNLLNLYSKNTNL